VLVARAEAKSEEGLERLIAQIDRAARALRPRRAANGPLSAPLQPEALIYSIAWACSRSWAGAWPG
jgi:hypothetical protein